MHAWIGLWGAMLGLLFGTTGILLNHRTTLKIPAAQVKSTSAQLEVPADIRGDREHFAAWLGRELGLGHKKPHIVRDAGRTLTWEDRQVTMPERWQLYYDTPDFYARAEYWAGNKYVAVTRHDPNLFALLNRLHMASGASTGWILLADTLAGGIVLLSVTGVLLWTRLHGPKLLAAGLIVGSLCAALCSAWLGL